MRAASALGFFLLVQLERIVEGFSPFSDEQCAILCATLVQNGTLHPVCQRSCEVLEEQYDEPCVQALANSSTEHLTLLSYCSGHVLETLAILEGASSGNADEANFIADLRLNDRGSPESCHTLKDTHYCVGKASTIASLGLCLPRSCDSAAVTRILTNVTNSLAPSVSGSGIPYSRAWESGATATESVVVLCEDELQLSMEAGTIAVLAMISFLVALVVTGTVLDHRRRRLDNIKKPAHAVSTEQPTESSIHMPRGERRLWAASRDENNRPSIEEDGNKQSLIDRMLDPEISRANRHQTGHETEELRHETEELGHEFLGADRLEGDLSKGIKESNEDQLREPLLNAHFHATSLRPPETPDRILASGDDSIIPWWWACLECFSLRKNVAKLLGPPRASNEFSALDGVRTLSMLWVVLGHALMCAILGAGVSNEADLVPIDGQGLLARFTAQVFPGGFFAVDSFFLMSGFLLSVTLLSKMESGSFGCGLLVARVYLHRYLRLTPTVLFMTLMMWQVVPLMGDGVEWWSLAESTKERCTKYWWTEIVYVSNLVPWSSAIADGCLTVTWYLSNDTQFYILGLLLVVLYRYRPRASVAILVALMLGSCAYTLWMGFYYNVRFSIFTAAGGTDWVMVYTAPWSRCPVYIIGLLCGFVWHAYVRGRVLTNKDQQQEQTQIAEKRLLVRHRATVPVTIVVAAVLLALPVYGTYWTYQDAIDVRIPEWADHLYLAFARPAWAMGLALMCVLCFCGHGGLVNKLLAWPAWTTPSRLTFCAYLVHLPLLTVLYGSRDVPVRYTSLEFAFTYMGAVMGTFALATALHLLVEAPFSNLESWGRRQWNGK